jgi:peptidoglycan/LPS O-acetylase OafA/YrhL
LRGIFALMVVISHVEYLRHNFGLPNYFFNPVFFHLGKIGVTGFFVLSGFLITNNLLKMKFDNQLTPWHKLKLFYKKRMLRIFPLYYIIIGLGIFVFPKITALFYSLPLRVIDARPIIHEVSPWFYCLLPQVPLANGIVLPFAEPTWSIGVEEMFYLLIPLIILFTGLKKNWLLIFSGILIAVKIFYWLFIPKYYADPVLNFLVLSRFECIFMGCYTAYLYYEKHPVLNKLNKKYFYISLVLFFICLWLLQLELIIYMHFAIVFSVIILFAAMHNNYFLENKFLAFIGKISFSLYMTHEIVLVFLLNKPAISTPEEHSGLLLYLLALVLSVITGWIFFKAVEEPFMKMKEKLK